jgi:predicted ATP-grasp superfamily ATP-dependent carboligase
MPAVLLGGAVNALSVARSLWRAGVAVDLLADGRGESVARHSRAVRRYVTATGSGPVAERWMGWLSSESAPAVVLPCCDEGLEFIARNRAELVAAGHRPVEADDAALLNMLDKARSYELAREAGIEAPQTVTVTELGELAELDFAFPCGIKPLHSHLFARRFNTAAKGVTVATLEDATRVLQPILDEGHPMLITEVIPGPDDQYRSYYTYLDEHGEPLLHFTKRKLRQHPTHFGLGSYHLTEWNAEVAELGLAFARAAGLRGLANVEFKRDARDGRLKLIECNPRFTEVNEQVRAAGIDLALVAYNRLLGRPLPAIDSFKDHLGLWFPVDDLRALRDYRRHDELTTLAWLRTLAHRQVPLLFCAGDPKPSLTRWRERATALGRKAYGGARRRPPGFDGSQARDPYRAAG